MKKENIEFSGRTFTAEDIETIQWTRKTYPRLKRSELAATICEFLEWTTPAGLPKLQQCLELFNILEAEGLLEAPPAAKASVKKTRKELPDLIVNTEVLEGKAKDFEPITLEIARPGEDLKRWRSYMAKYHMVGDKQVFGSRLQYFIMSHGRELGCIQFSASAWALEERDIWIDWTKEDKKQRLHLVLNNSRYLIFPWIHIKNLASKALALAANRIQEDWLKEYCYAPVLLETFVDTEYFEGTCYKAANWVFLGNTKGEGRSRDKSNPKSPKAIYVLPLQKDFRKILRGEKPAKTIDPESR